MAVVKFQEFQVLPGKNKFTDLRGLHAQKESKRNNYRQSSPFFVHQFRFSSSS